MATDTGAAPLLWCVDERNFATKRGRIIRTVRERYLRDDLSCSLPHCTLCSADQDTTAATHVMGTTKAVLSRTPRRGRYILPTMEVVLRQMDVLEHSTKTKKKMARTESGGDDIQEEVFADVIILETVWEHVKRSDLAVYNRLRALLMNADRRFVVFANEHHRSCFVQKTKTPDGVLETDADRHRRAVATAWTWYAAHLQALSRQDDVEVLLLANDADDLARAAALGVGNAMTLTEFLDADAAQYPELRDLVASVSGDPAASGNATTSTGGKRKSIYPEHLPLSELLAGVKSKRFFQGVLRCNRDHWLESHVLIHGADGARVPVLIQGREHVNRAMDGDVVAIQLLPKAQWRSPSDSFVSQALAEAQEEDEQDQDQDDAAAVAEPTISPQQAELVQSEQALTLKPTGKVVGIVQRNWRKYCGSLEPPRSAAAAPTSSTSWLVVPVDRRVPKIKIQTRQAETLMDKRLLVAIDAWPADSKYPLGHYVKTLGRIGDKETETSVLLIEHDIPCDQFSDEVMRCLPPEDWTITPENSAGRRDLRGLPVCSIDPPGCKDIDDALHVTLLPNGNLQVGVHIADVTHFVAPGSALDEEAADRGTSTYLVDRRLDMLPGLLTTKLCSLTDVEDHFAFSVLWEMRWTTPDCEDIEIVDVQFCKSLIRSIASLSYQQAQVFLDDPGAGGVLGMSVKTSKNQYKSKKPLSHADVEAAGLQNVEEAKRQTLGNGVKTLHAIATRLRAKRIAAGALTLASPEVKFVLDTETQNPLDVQMYTLRDTNALVEEFMLLANITVAKKIVRHFPTFSMLRRHPAPSKRQFEQLCSQARAVGVELHVDSSKQLQDSLDRAQQQGTAARKNRYFDKLLRILTTRCMMPAAYFSSGEVQPAEFHHYGLAAPIYTHFTSPIRRYADVVVHRLLAAAIGVTPLPSYLENKSHLHDIAEQLNRRHHAAQLAGRASVTLHTVLYFERYPTETDAVVTKVKNNGIGVLLPRFGIEGMIFMDTADGESPKKTQSSDADGPQFVAEAFNAERHELRVLYGDAPRTLKVFDAVQVKVFVARTFGNRQELRMELLPEEATEKRPRDSHETAPAKKQKTAKPKRS
ncbi:hypothetical protein P43SY_004109 [Pythium insidiosum]|uniref:RNB domain-containing protein n=1 Tax=Pythium insidiosum TaxID=114742 RepID=A0AAD5M530_PYTIN|nr:hypothetical protein P43SY_004109 [Pythium insidiosum]